MNSSSSLRWIGWSAIFSGMSMILSAALIVIAISQGSITPGTRTHSVVVETLDVLTTGLLLPVPLAFYWLYRDRAPRLSLFALWLGTFTLAVGTIKNVLFVLEILWFSDVAGMNLIFGLGFIVWLICAAILAHQSGKPRHGTLMNAIGASIVGFPIWVFWLGYLLASGKLAAEPREAVQTPAMNYP